MVAMPQAKSAWNVPLGDAPTSIPSAFRQASDEDTRNVLNAMAACPQSPQLEFYVVTAEWMTVVLPFLQGISGEEKPEFSINNASLLAATAEHAVSSSDDEEDDGIMSSKSRRKRKQAWRAREHAKEEYALKPSLVLERDYVLVGPHVWILIGGKFGYDVALPRKIVFSGVFESKLGVEVYGEEMPIAVPACGYYSYSFSEKSSAAAPVVADDTDEEQHADLFPGCNDDDGNHDNAMDTEIYNDNPVVGFSTPPRRNNNSVLLLPASTTSAYNNNDDDDNDMDLQDLSQKRKRHASGLSNLGNTCFMNSTLQCLAHTDPLRRYFLSEEFVKDLNRENVLGTGGELASKFASLLKEMWVSSSSSTSSYSSAVYPRPFKTALGKHAEQFMGYDQHDSQEFATYLLDALHEDTNRITKKPYIEKPEQKEDQSDEDAAAIAWKLHLEREDSRVLDNFMGQVKSRVQCPHPGCGRVSTTFDPFMYLSVPIPGSSEHSLKVIFFSLEEGNYTFHLTMNKMATIEMMQKLVATKFKQLKGGHQDVIDASEDMVSVDVWSHHFWNHGYELNSCVDSITDTDVTHIYQLKSVDQVMKDAAESSTGDNRLAIEALNFKSNYQRHRLDIPTLTEMNVGDNWMGVLKTYMRSDGLFLEKLLNAKRSSHEERVQFYQKLEGFIEICHLTSDGKDSDDDSGSDDAEMATSSDENPQEDKKRSATPSLEERSQTSRAFHNVKNVKDLAKLEHCSKMFRKRALELLEVSTTKYEKGIVVEVVMRRKSTMASPRGVSYGNSSGNFSVPLCLRLPPNMTIYGLREELARQLGKYLKTDYLSRADTKPPPPPPPPPSDDMVDVKIAACDVTPDESNAGSDQSDAAVAMETCSEKSNEENSSSSSSPNKSLASSFDLGSPDLLIMRRLPLTYHRYIGNNKGNIPSHQLGMLESFGMHGQPMTLANKDDEAEQRTVAEVVGHNGTVFLNWSDELCNQVFDVEKYEAAEIVEDPDQKSKVMDKVITVKDCIDKYCHKEQLDETDVWYCSRCKDHVRAWKQFHLYRSPPILIVHLKRFQYSSSTHRRNKIDTFIDFPLTGLDLTNEFTQWTEETKPIYDCYAVSNHFGGLGGGHYTAYALSDEGTWTNFDDSRVTTDVDPKDVVSSAAYVLYYRRRDVELDGPGDELMESSPVPAIVPDSFFEPQQESSARLGFNTSLDSPMGDPLDDEVRSTASSKGSMQSIEQEDPYGSTYEQGFKDSVEELRTHFPSQ